MTRRPFPLVAIVAVAFVLAACNGGEGVPSGGGTPLQLPSTADALPNVDVASFHEVLDGLKGTPVVVNLWASWCGPCKSEIPKFVKAAADTPGVQFLGVDVQDSRGGAEAFIAEHGVPYPSLFDPSGVVMTDVGGIGPPVTLFIAADGTVATTIKGEISQAALDAGLAQIAP